MLLSVHVAWAYAGFGKDTVLPPEEAARVACLKYERDRDLQMTSYVLRRTVLAAETGFQPEHLQFGTKCNVCRSETHGRPLLRRPLRSLDFNVSHSGKIAAIAVSKTPAVGLDVENLDHLERAWRDVRESVLHRNDDASLSIAQLWTAKEALLKLTGHGLTLPMSSIALERLGNGEGQARLQHRGVRQSARVTWIMLDANHIAALATATAAQITVSENGGPVGGDWKPPLLIDERSR